MYNRKRFSGELKRILFSVNISAVLNYLPLSGRKTCDKSRRATW